MGINNRHNFGQWLIIGIIVASIGFFALSQKRLNLFGTRARTASMIINFSPDNQRAFEGETGEGLTILEALFSSTQNNDIKLIYTVDEKNEVLVATIDGQPNNTGGKKWYFYINDEFIETKDINKVFVYPRDTIEAVYK